MSCRMRRLKPHLWKKRCEAATCRWIEKLSWNGELSWAHEVRVGIGSHLWRHHMREVQVVYCCHSRSAVYRLIALVGAISRWGSQLVEDWGSSDSRRQVRRSEFRNFANDLEATAAAVSESRRVARNDVDSSFSSALFLFILRTPRFRLSLRLLFL